MSTTAITDGACYHQSLDTVQVKRALMDASARRVLLVDHTQLRRHALHELAPVSAFDLVVVDAGIAAADLAELREWGAPVEVAAEEGEAQSGARGHADRSLRGSREQAAERRVSPAAEA